MRESASLIAIPYLHKMGAKISYYDPSGEKKEFAKLKNVVFCSSINDACFKADLILILTEWDEFKSIDFKKLVNKKTFKLFDMRNLFSTDYMKKKGINYYSIGRNNT